MSIISLIIIYYGDAKLLWNLLDSLERHPDKELFDEVIVVNNGLTLDEKNHAELERYKALPVQVVNNPQKSYASGLNRGAVSARGDILIISNNDVEWLPNSSIQPLLDRATEDKTGIVGPQLVYPDGKWQRSYGSFPSVRSALVSVMMLDSFIHFIRARQFRLDNKKNSKHVDYIDGAFMCIRRDCFQEIGGFDENFQFYSEDADFCLRAHKVGWRVLFDPRVRIVHLRGASSTKKALTKYTRFLLNAQLHFVKTHYGQLYEHIYRHLIKFAFLERVILYHHIAKFYHSSQWQERAEEAKIRYVAIRGISNNS